jgi:hypothetical protein
MQKFSSVIGKFDKTSLGLEKHTILNLTGGKSVKIKKINDNHNLNIPKFNTPNLHSFNSKHTYNKKI